MKMPLLQSRGKKIVLEDGDTSLIIGRFEPEEEIPVILHLPFSTEEGGEEVRMFSLIKVKPRFALYREVAAPATSRFNDTFNPAQV